MYQKIEANLIHKTTTKILMTIEIYPTECIILNEFCIGS